MLGADAILVTAVVGILLHCGMTKENHVAGEQGFEFETRARE